jgi:succinyl-diaminopimelate desuccinylase
MTQPELTTTRKVVIQLAEQLIATRTPNPPGDERAAATLITELLARHRIPPPRVLAKSKERPNLLTSIDFGSGGRHLCLAGHLDTKPAGSAPWRTDPWHATVADGRLVGLGAVDMKGAIAAIIVAVERLVLDPPPRGRLSLLFTADEEDGAQWGAHYLASAHVLDADGVAIMEPGGLDRDFDRLHIVSRGIARFHIGVTGDQSHASLSDRSGAINASVELARLLAEFNDCFHPSAPAQSSGIEGWRVTVTGGVRLTGGVGYGVVPGLAAFDAEVRLLPGMTRSQLEHDLHAFVAAQVLKNPRLRPTVRFDDPPRDWLPATQVTVDDPLVGAARDALRGVFGSAPPGCVFPGTTDAAFLQGMAGIPTLPALGPGLVASAHGANEWVSIDALVSSVELYEALARTYCA